jgi:spoIIIJ-associated protein
MKSIESSAKSMEEAVTQGLEKLGVSLGDVTIDIIDEGSKGLFGLLGGKPARVRLTVKETEEDADILSTLSMQDTGNADKPKAQPAKGKALGAQGRRSRKGEKGTGRPEERRARAGR